ncbi:transcriptional regulator [Streptomyces sp. TRM S81-3]|uniref:Transcriptional regulator n=1 Tax=Streptomyces griseicoloratus TaxID=2752516 RepID=A0A926QRF0_9ACTN|nr:transcriptional regulator [Streptomyces griseicoloratus]MBD0421373.1 transcriptional regulator [Streptomyces griseicoloratus]
MARTARQLLETTTGKLAPDPGANRLVPLVARGAAGRDTLAALALEQRWVIAADRRSFLYLADRAAEEPETAAWFTALAEGENLAGQRLEAFAAACGVNEQRTVAYEPLPGCQAYPAYVAWLALNGSPSEVVLALHANFSAWGGYCATIAAALRRHYGFTDEACAFFDFFAEPDPALERTATAAVQAALDAGRLSEDLVRRYGRLLRSYEAMFWHTLWEREVGQED